MPESIATIATTLLANWLPGEDVDHDDQIARFLHDLASDPNLTETSVS